MAICKCGFKTENPIVLVSLTKGKKISMCNECYDKRGYNLHKGHGYVLDIEHSKEEQLDHFCSYNGIEGENKEELLRIVNQWQK